MKPRMRSDLAEAQKSRLHLQQQLTALTSTTASLRARLEASEGTIATLQRERATLGRRLRDRDEELKMKAKLLDDVQCEVVTFDLQLNMAEEKVEGLRKENEELVARWMARMRVEAEEMNKDMEF
ncbi:hypothetical protein KEM56_004408 [Ascosphaera pollenicola]|nr:hypothetical protein KEM56_004408 [Ascosphaera pollenicola]